MFEKNTFKNNTDMKKNIFQKITFKKNMSKG